MTRIEQSWVRTLGVALGLFLVSLLIGGCSVGIGGSAAPTPILPADGTLPAPPLPAPASTPQVFAAADLAALPAAEQLRMVTIPPRDMVALRTRLDPAIAIAATATAAAPAPGAPDYAVGDTTTFYVHNSDTAVNREINATLVHKTDVAYAWVETGQAYDADAIARSIDIFSERIYPAAVTAFGREPFPGMDGDPRLHVLHTTGMGGAAGYFLGGDQISRLGYPYSNQKEMFYISLDWLAYMTDAETYETVLAHEFQHMIHSAHDANEEVWINEGLSEYAQEVAGYPADLGFANSFSMRPDTQLNAWGGAVENNSAHYGASYLFVRYLVQRFGPPIVQAIVDEQANGIEGVRRVLAAHNSSFEDLFADWLVALALDDPDALDGGGRFGYTELDPMPSEPAATLTTWPVTQTTATAANFTGSAYYLDGARPDGAGSDGAGAEDGGAVTFVFDGETTTTLAQQAPAAGTRAFWSNRGDMGEARLTRLFDLADVDAGAPLTLSVRTAWDIEPDYDYGYVMASSDGAAWTILPGQRTTRLNTAGNNLGYGYSGSSATGDAAGGGADAGATAWVTETFDLAAYAGGPLHLRFSYVTDDAVTRPGWWIDDLRIDALGYSEDFEGDAPGWQSEGWLLTDGVLPQPWLLQLATLQDGALVDLQRIAVDAEGDASIPITGLGNGRSAIVFISPMAEGTTTEAVYQYAVVQ